MTLRLPWVWVAYPRLASHSSAMVQDPRPIAATAPADRRTMGAEHGMQVRLLDALLEAKGRAAPADEVSALLEQLTQYCDVHFLSEELLMRNHAYPDYQAHADAHDQAMERLRALDADTPAERLTELRALVLQHIQSFDQQLEGFLEAT